MSNSPSSSSSDSDTLVLIGVGVLVLGGAGAGAALAWAKVLAWGLEKQVLLPAAANPLVVLPGSAGAGFDLARIAVAAAVVALVLAVVGTAAVKKMRGDGDLR